MATRTFLTKDQWGEAQQILRPPSSPPDGRVLFDHSLVSALDFSSWLSLTVESRFRKIDGWEEALPIAIGSWGRGELCPGSDLDVVFCGKTKAIRHVINELEPMGLKLRHRVPEDLSNWSVGVDVLEVNALFHGKAFSQEGHERLQEQKQLIQKNSRSFRRQLLKAMTQERRQRFKRYDSIANFLEPNLKFGAGGLRDLQQALILSYWFPERFEEDEYAFKVLNYFKHFLLMIRHKLHLQKAHDQLTAGDQHELVAWFGFENHRSFMAEVQKGLSRVSFHSDWTIERCQKTQKSFTSLKQVKMNTWSEAHRQLKKDPSLQVQAGIRKKLYDTQGFKKERLAKAGRGKILKSLLDIKTEDDVMWGAFRSHMVSHLIPSFTPVIGLVQHDQYHRFSVDAHLMQAVKEVRRLYLYPKLLGKLQFYTEKLKLNDWNILRWAALYHDMGKGQKGQHAQVGRDMVLKDLKSFGFSKDFVKEVAWIVENHLILSTAAFRKNPQSPKTWEFLYSRGLKGDRLYRLAIFTAIDIMATNPDAWNSWKESLLYDIVETLRNPNQERHYEFSQKVQRLVPDVPKVFLNRLDHELLDNVSQKTLLNDFTEVLSGKNLKPLIVRDKKARIWVRFHRKLDQQGLVLEFTRRLTGLGCNIRQAYVYTDVTMGVYDWFCVKSHKSVQVLKKQMDLDLALDKQHSTLFSQVDLVSSDDEEWVFSFRAKDKKGLLLSAIQSLHNEDLDIIWAKVHTWGRQIDDVFGVSPKSNLDPQAQLARLQKLLEKPELEIFQ